MISLCPNLAMIFLGYKTLVTLIFVGSSKNPGLSLHFFRIFMHVYKYLGRKLADIFELQLSRTDIFGLLESLSD